MQGSAVDPQTSSRRRTTALDIVTVVVMGLSSVATAWSSYQSALWGGLQSESFTRAAGLRVEASEASANASNLMAIDIAVFTSWVDAAGEGEDEGALSPSRHFHYRAWRLPRGVGGRAPHNPPPLGEGVLGG